MESSPQQQNLPSEPCTLNSETDRNWPSPTVSDVHTDNLQSSQQKDGSMHSVTLPQAVNKDW